MWHEPKLWWYQPKKPGPTANDSRSSVAATSEGSSVST
jgi:hypothetical protein